MPQLLWNYYMFLIQGHLTIKQAQTGLAFEYHVKY